MRKCSITLTCLALLAVLCTGCGANTGAASEPVSSEPAASAAASSADRTAAPALADGVYSAVFETDSTMFRVNETCDDRGTLTVENGEMTLHVSLTSKNIVNLFPGTAEDAQKDGAVWLQPTPDTVTYSDGLSEEVNGFDVPVPVLGEEFDLALLGKKGKWYDHKAIVRDPEPLADGAQAAAPVLEDGSYTCALTLEGGSGRATVESPAALRVENGAVFATLVWSSPNYDYMKVDGQKYEPLNAAGNSTFEIPVGGFDTPLTVIADTVAMSTPHEVTYTLTFDAASLQKTEA